MRTKKINKRVEYSYFCTQANATLYSHIDVDVPTTPTGAADEGWIVSNLPRLVKSRWRAIKYNTGDLFSVSLIAVY